MTYHQWLKDEELPLPEPVANSTLIPITMGSKKIMCGIGIHDSSASLAPYILKSREEFVLISTGTWCINMNPFNAEALTMGQLEKDCLSYMSISQKPVKSSRLFMGHIHDVNTKRLTEHFKVSDDAYKKAGCNTKLISTLKGTYKQRVFFNAGVPEEFIDERVDLNQFGSFEEAYHQLILDLTSIEKDTLDLVLTQNSNTKSIYISGGFARNEIFVREMASLYPEMNIYTSEIDNATALGAALVVWDAMNEPLPDFDLGLKYWTKF